MLEHEAKILEVNEAEISGKLEKLGAKKILDDVTYIEGFDFDGISANSNITVPEKFSQIAEHIDALRGSTDMFSQGAYLRLRREGSRYELIFKQKVKGGGGVKSETEISVEITEAEWQQTAEVLRGMGLKRIVLQEKKRVSYKYAPYRYDIDTWPGVPTYLEVEAPTPEGVMEAIALLGLAQQDAVSMSAAEVFDIYGVKNPRHLVFSQEK